MPRYVLVLPRNSKVSLGCGQKSVESFGVKTLKRIIAPLCARTSKKQESVPGVWAGLFHLPDQNIKSIILRRFFPLWSKLKIFLDGVGSKFGWANDRHRFLCFQWWRLSAVRCLQWAFPCWRLPWPGPFCRCSKTRRRPDSGPRRRAACVWFPVRYHHTVIVSLSLNCT